MFKQLFNQYRNNTRVKQVLGLFSVNIIGIPIGIVTSIVVTRYLGAEGYGDYKFIISIFNLAIIIFTFGLFQAGNRALVLNDNKQKAREYYGTELVITGALFIIMYVFLIIYALFDNNIQEKGLSKILLYTIPFGWVFLLQRYFETLFQADNRIRGLAQIRLFPKLVFLIAVGIIYFFLMKFDVNRVGIVISFFIASQLIVYVIVIARIKVSFKNLRLRLGEIWDYNKKFGLNVYIGSVFAVGFARLTEILISYFGADNSGVGFYALALTFAMPLSFIPNTIATTHYKDFSKSNAVPRKLLLTTICLSLAALLGLWVIVPPFVRFFYGIEFESVILLNFIVSIGVIAHGFGDFFNRYLGANGQGKALRNSSIIVGIGILAFSLILIPKYGEKGAAYAKLISGLIYITSIIFYYLRYIKKTNNKN